VVILRAVAFSFILLAIFNNIDRMCANSDLNPNQSIFQEKEVTTMKDKQSLHLKVQELADCFATTDPLKEMSTLARDADMEEAALKWLALATLHGINSNAEKISLTKRNDGTVTVTAEYRRTELPSPGPQIGEKILGAARGITHLEGDKGKTPLALGVRDGNVELDVKLKRSEKGETLTLKFPAA
jgi:hypothetical protein